MAFTLTVRSTSKNPQNGTVTVTADDVTPADFPQGADSMMSARPNTPDTAIRLTLTVPEEKLKDFAPVVGTTITAG